MTQMHAQILLSLLALILVGIAIIAVALHRMLWRTSSRRQRVVLPMSSGHNVLPESKCCTAQITSRPEHAPFRPERLIIGGHPERWIVNDIRIGNISQFAQSGDVPGEMFASGAIDCFLRMDAVAVGQGFTIIVTYVGDERGGEPFVCGVLGTTLSERELRRAHNIERRSSLREAAARAAA